MRNILLAFALNLFIVNGGCAQPKIEEYKADGALQFMSFFNGDAEAQELVYQNIRKNWNEGYIPVIIETVYLVRDPEISYNLITILQQKTGKQYGYEFNDWYRWLWNREEKKLDDYHEFKANLYKLLDPKFETYFKDRGELARIRLDEIRWGGVGQDGIPPLRQPEMLSAEEALYLKDDNVVFGIEVNGDVRAYPKRILAWHEMFVDEVGGQPVAGVYCTLCGTVVLYHTEHKGINHQLGTSGFLYRSNKLMYDKDTQTLWNTILGEPVLGPLVDKGIALEYLSVVTTTWGEWKDRHPNTKVLSLNTGHYRDYGEGVAYNDYFSNDQLMFNTPFNDKRLKNKDEVLALRLPEYPKEQLAISAKYLKKHPVYNDKIGDRSLVVLTDASGGNRVYESKGIDFLEYDQKFEATDSYGVSWKLEESKLTSSDGRTLQRLPYHRAFWFGWHAVYPETRLVK